MLLGKDLVMQDEMWGYKRHFKMFKKRNKNTQVVVFNRSGVMA